jgi:hypothetical protein
MGATHQTARSSGLSTRAANVTPDFSSVAARSGLTRVVTKRTRPWFGASFSGSFSSPWIESPSISTSFTFCCARSCWNSLYGRSATVR